MVKNGLKNLLCLLLASVLLCSCTAKNESEGKSKDRSPEAEVAETSQQDVPQQTENKENHAVYELDDLKSEFNAAMEENPIDRAYTQQFDAAGTISEMTAAE